MFRNSVVQPWLAAIFFSTSTLCLAGCGEKAPVRYRLSGKITWAGKPIPAGILYFDPDLAAGVDGPQGYAIIEKGMYDTMKGGAGHAGGNCVIRLHALDGVSAPEAYGGRPLFPEYFWSEALPAIDDTKDIDVPADVRARLSR
jgi:hypothetical protein